MENERLEALVKRGRALARGNCASATEAIIREAWLMGRSEYVDHPPFVECKFDHSWVQLSDGQWICTDCGLRVKYFPFDEITEEGDLP